MSHMLKSWDQSRTHWLSMDMHLNTQDHDHCLMKTAKQLITKLTSIIKLWSDGQNMEESLLSST
jgi:hypothetical protein